MDNFKKLALDTAIQKLFTADSFSICTLDEIIKVLKVVPNGEIYQQLRLLHCVSYRDMPNELKAELQQKVVACITDFRFNPALVSANIMHMADGGNDFAPTEDRYIDGTVLKFLPGRGR